MSWHESLTAADLTQGVGVLMGVAAFVLSVVLAVLRRQDLTRPRVHVDFDWGMLGTPGRGDAELVYSVTATNRGYIPARINGVRIRFKTRSPNDIMILTRFMEGPRLPHRLEIQDAGTWINRRADLQATFERNGNSFPVRFYAEVLTTSGVYKSRRFRRTDWPRFFPLGRLPVFGSWLGRLFPQRYHLLSHHEEG